MKCRARVAPKCEHGSPCPSSLTEDLDPWREDGTYLPESDDVVCTICYVELGAPLNAALPGAIASHRRVTAL